MDFVNIQSASNPLIKRVRSLRSRSGRSKTGLFLAEGESVLEEALNTTDLTVVDLIATDSYQDLDRLAARLATSKASIDADKIVLVDEKLFKELSTTESPTGLMAVLKTRQHSLVSILARDNFLVSLAYEVNDPGNLGTMFRTSLAFGADALLISKGSVDPHNPKVVRAAAGALFALPFVTDIDTTSFLDELSTREAKAIALVAGAEASILETDMSASTVLLMGNEARGLPDSILAKADLKAAIPMQTCSESLNVSIAHAITLFEAYKQRSKEANLDKISPGSKKASK